MEGARERAGKSFSTRCLLRGIPRQKTGKSSSLRCLLRGLPLRLQKWPCQLRGQNKLVPRVSAHMTWSSVKAAPAPALEHTKKHKLGELGGAILGIGLRALGKSMTPPYVLKIFRANSWAWAHVGSLEARSGLLGLLKDMDLESLEEPFWELGCAHLEKASQAQQAKHIGLPRPGKHAKPARSSQPSPQASRVMNPNHLLSFASSSPRFPTSLRITDFSSCRNSTLSAEAP